MSTFHFQDHPTSPVKYRRLYRLGFILSFLVGATLPASAVEPVLPAAPYTVWIFLDPECPICQSYTRTLRTLHERFAADGFEFKGLYTTPGIKTGEIKKFHQMYQLPFSGEIDQNYALAKRLNATTTPEVVVTSALGQVLYKGAIDNWYYALGKNRPEPTEHYLKDALEAIAAHQSVSQKRTKAIGCLMNL